MARGLIGRMWCRVAGHRLSASRVSSGAGIQTVWTACDRCGRLVDWREAP